VRIYLAGPMRSIDLFNFPEFDRVTAILRAQGHEVRSPAENDREHGFDPTLNELAGFDLHEAMRWDIGAVLWADAVVLLSGWESSKGCEVELVVANAIGVAVHEWSDDAQAAL
jgi:nucleoside 2-deoxyribosyltransferase